MAHDDEGGVIYDTPVPLSKFKGNVNYNNCGKIQEEYGLDYKIDMTITTTTDINVSINDVVSYQGKLYTVRDLYKRDSHLMLVAQLYQPVR